MLEKLKEYLAEQLRIDVSEIADDARLMEDLGADSLDIVELMMTVESEHGIVIPDDDIPELKTVSDIANYLESKNPDAV